MILLTRVYRFSAAHRLHAPSLSEEENRELYGKCNQPYGHGHDYVLEVAVAGGLDEESGKVVNLAQLDELVRSCVLTDFAHRDLNTEVPEFREAVPTSENVAAVIQNRLAKAWRSRFPGEWPRLEIVRLQETKRNRFELKS